MMDFNSVNIDKKRKVNIVTSGESRRHMVENERESDVEKMTL